MLANCSETRVEDHAAVPAPGSGAPVISAARLGRVLILQQVALPVGIPNRARHEAEAEKAVWETIAALPIPHVIPATVLGPRPTAGWSSLDDAELLAAARRVDADTVMMLTVEEYARSGHLFIAIALPPVWWDSKTSVSLRLRLLDVRSGVVLADLRRDRESGGTYVDRTPAQLPGELEASLRSLIGSP